MWLSCSSFFQQFFHCYCPVKFGRKADANGDFIRRYLPILKNFPTRYIHEPWTAPDAVQKSAKCIIGQDYPTPMCNHEYVSKLNMERMKQIFNQLAIFRHSIISIRTNSLRISCIRIKLITATGDHLELVTRSSLRIRYHIFADFYVEMLLNPHEI